MPPAGDRADTPMVFAGRCTLANFICLKLDVSVSAAPGNSFFNQALAAWGQNLDQRFLCKFAGRCDPMTTTQRITFTKLNQKQAAAAAARHEMLYAGRVGGARAVFAFCDLSGLDLSGRNLADADFTGAILEETNLAGARLETTSFFGADLRRANLAGACLRRADLRGASLRGANLIGADLYEADLREGTIAEKDRYGELRVLQHDVGPSELPSALLNSANLERAKMTGVMAVQADFSDAVMRGCRLSRANLRQAKLNGANLENADLTGCNMTGAEMHGAILIGTRLSRTVLDGVDLSDALTDAPLGRDLSLLPAPVAELLDAHSRWVESDGREGKPVDLTEMDLRSLKSLTHRALTALIAPGAVFYGLDMRGVLLQGSNLQGADLRGTQLAGADLRGANLSGAKLNNADLRDAKLGPLLISDARLLPARLDGVQARYADFRGADLRRAKLSEADLSYSNLSDCDVRDSDLGRAVLTGAKLPAVLPESVGHLPLVS